jgi:hypothetical protein
MRKDEIEKLQDQIRLLRSGLGSSLLTGSDVTTPTPGPSTGCPSTYSRLLYVKRSELIRREALQVRKSQEKNYYSFAQINRKATTKVVKKTIFKYINDIGLSFVCSKKNIVLIRLKYKQ